MAARRIGQFVPDWIKIATKVPNEAKPNMNSLRMQYETIKTSLDAVAAKPEPINWDYYAKNIAKPGMVEAFRKAYEAITVPYPKDKETPDIDQKEKELEEHAVKTVKLANEEIARYEAELQKIKSMKPFEEMTSISRVNKLCVFNNGSARAVSIQEKSAALARPLQVLQVRPYRVVCKRFSKLFSCWTDSSSSWSSSESSLMSSSLSSSPISSKTPSSLPSSMSSSTSSSQSLSSRFSLPSIIFLAMSMVMRSIFSCFSANELHTLITSLSQLQETCKAAFKHPFSAMKRKSRKRKQNTQKSVKRKKARHVARTTEVLKKIAPDWSEGKICEKEDLCGDIVKELGKREQKWAVALMFDQCELLNDSAKSELRTMLGFSESESSSNASDGDESSDQDNLSSINDSKDSERNSDDGADDSDVTEQCQEEDSGSVFTAVEAYDSSSAEDIGPYWNTMECTPYM